jgi:hypothetical protein
MAQVAQITPLAKRINHALDVALGEWSGVPELAKVWPNWDEHSQFSFVMDWPVSEDRLQQLAHWSDQELLSPRQLSRYTELLGLVERYRPVPARHFEE